MNKKQFIKVQNLRYRISAIKRYEPFVREDIKGTQFGIYIYFSMLGTSNKVYHLFSTERERDAVLIDLDTAFVV